MFPHKMLLQLLQIAQNFWSKYIISHFVPLNSNYCFNNLNHSMMHIVQNSKHQSFPTPLGAEMNLVLQSPDVSRLASDDSS